MKALKFLQKWLSPPLAVGNRGVPAPGIRIVEGKIIPNYGCELNAVDHCNLACNDCNHASPVSNKRWADPETVYRDFSILAKVFKPQQVKVLGGEPLLHPNLVEVIEAVKRSRICDDILVVTNGLLLPRMGDVFWQAVKHLEISIYPNPKLDHDTLEFCRKKAAEHGIHLNVVQFSEFRRTFSVPGFQDSNLARRVYQACKLAHVWGCYSIHEGYFYKCPQSIYIPQMLGWPEDRYTADGIEIKDSPDFLENLYCYLTSLEPLQSCRHCLDSHGKVRPITQVRPKDWLAQHNEPAEALLDYGLLRKNEEERSVIKPDEIKTKIGRYST